MKKSGYFWVSYADLMTSLFFVMLVLYIVTFSILRVKLGTIQADADKLKEIENVEEALSTLDTNYFVFDEHNKRYKLVLDAKFKSGSDNIIDIPKSKRIVIKDAGIELYAKMKRIIADNPDVNYLLIIEGNTQRSNNNWNRIPNEGYKLSYRRALALYNYWKKNGVNFGRLGENCEVIIAGSGYFGQSREKDEIKNRKFSIQITSKVGQFLEKKKQNEKN